MAGNGRQRLCLPPPRSKEERDNSRRLFEAGDSYRAICDATGVPISTLRVWKAREAWQKPDSQLATAPATREEIDTAVPDTLQECAEEYESNMAAASVIVSRRVAQMPADEVVHKADRLKSFDGVARRALKISEDKPRCAIQIGILCNSPARHDRERALPSMTRPQKALPAVEAESD
jgi:hypothetical protein